MPKTPDPKGKPPTARGCEGFSGVSNTYGRDLKPPVNLSPIQQFAQRARAVIAGLATQFPDCFVVNERQRRPLKVGIHRDILAATTAFSADELSAGLKYYTGALGYLAAVVEGAERTDLAGNAAGSCTARDAEYAAKKTAKHKAKSKARAETRANKPKPVVATPKRLSLADLREAARLRKQRESES
jgi:ProP effector